MSEISFVKYSPAAMTITVINNVDGPTAFNVNCYVKLKRGNLIVDDGRAGFGCLEEGELRKEDAKFRDLTETDVVDYKEILLSWYNAEGIYYYETN
jgi:hypothetical protein